jgi:hypothetical protein
MTEEQKQNARRAAGALSAAEQGGPGTELGVMLPTPAEDPAAAALAAHEREQSPGIVSRVLGALGLGAAPAAPAPPEVCGDCDGSGHAPYVEPDLKPERCSAGHFCQACSRENETKRIKAQHPRVCLACYGRGHVLNAEERLFLRRCHEASGIGFDKISPQQKEDLSILEAAAKRSRQ